MQYGSNMAAIPHSKPIAQWRGNVCAAYTGPNAGLTKLDLESKSIPQGTTSKVAGCLNWNSAKEYAYGISLSLYEEDREKSRTLRESQASSSPCCIVGDPVADVFGVIVRENVCLMAIADGVNWGRKSRLAARCATHAVMEHITANLAQVNSDPTTSVIAQLLHESVTMKAQDLILEKHATLTTLSAAIVCEMGTPREWGLFVCAVGDSPVYIYCPHTRQVVEATVGCHADGIRDMRLAGGVLGPSFGSSPDFSNLTYAFVPVYTGDIVFAVSDGVSDNFRNKVMSGDKASLSPRTAVKSCCESVPHLTRVLNHHQDKLGSHLSAQTVAACLINHCVEVTDKKRHLRTCCLEQKIDMKSEAKRNPEFAAQLNAAAGKLDHATVVAYQVGYHH